MFEFDENKSRSNKNKHDIDFIEAQNLWADNEFVEINAVKVENEVRYTLTARYNKKLWTAVFTYRQDKIRIISVRRAREDEEEIYNNSRRI